MKSIHNPAEELEAIFWDFDGVLLNSNEIRDKGFSEVLKKYPKEQVNKLMAYHQANGGLSRYVKFRYFFEEVRGESITDEEVNQWAAKFSEIMMQLLTDHSLQISETLRFVKYHHQQIPMYVVSGSDQTELRKLCEAHGIAKYFKRIHGSPKPKKQWVGEILKEEHLNPEHCVLIGDSVNDFEAADINGLLFVGYNSATAEALSTAEIKF
jgi:HAD superfamily hydrolase (TIGR01549 family)